MLGKTDSVNKVMEMDKTSTSKSNTPCNYADNHSYPGSPLATSYTDEENVLTEEEGMVIKLVHTADSPWDTDEDRASITSTPGYRRGRHEEVRSQVDNDKQHMIDLILKEGMLYKLPKWLAKKRGHSVEILSDARMQDWPD